MGRVQGNDGLSLMNRSMLLFQKLMSKEMFDMPKNNFTDEQKKMLETSALNSQVGRSLDADLKQTVIFNY